MYIENRYRKRFVQTVQAGQIIQPVFEIVERGGGADMVFKLHAPCSKLFAGLAEGGLDKIEGFILLGVLNRGETEIARSASAE